MIVFRLSRKQYAKDLSGRGAEIAGGRWNSKGFAMIYTAESRALCTTEVAVHVPLGMIPKDYQMISIEIPDDLISNFDLQQLPEKWNSIPVNRSTQEIGNKFIQENEFLVLKVPSAVVEGDFNYLINPLHKKMNTIKIIEIKDYNFDKRLFI